MTINMFLKIKMEYENNYNLDKAKNSMRKCS